MSHCDHHSDVAGRNMWTPQHKFTSFRGIPPTMRDVLEPDHIHMFVACFCEDPSCLFLIRGGILLRNVQLSVTGPPMSLLAPLCPRIMCYPTRGKSGASGVCTCPICAKPELEVAQQLSVFGQPISFGVVLYRRP